MICFRIRMNNLFKFNNIILQLIKLKKIPLKPLLDRFCFLVSIAKIVLPEYKFKWPQLDWWDNEKFNLYLTKFGEDKNYNSDRRWMVYQLLRLVEGIEGDTAECGIYKGTTSWLICNSNKSSRITRHHFAFDSFCGLSEPRKEDGNHWKKGDLSCPLENAKINLSEFENVHFMQGWIPERFAEVAHRKFAFVHIDVDLYEPTLNSIEFFYPRISPGGIILCDDYGFNSCPGASKAADEFFLNKNEKMIALSGGGGFIIKDVLTSTI
jgi:O-methyltransferase